MRSIASIPILPGRSLSHCLLDTIGSFIVSGAYDARDFPTEEEWAKQYGVSRAVIRESLKMLATKGLIVARRRHGTSVQPTSAWNLLDPDILRWLLERKFSMALLRQFTQLRLGIEPEAAALAAECADRDQLKAIDRALDRILASSNDLESRPDAIIAFHAAVLEASQNLFFRQMSDVVTAALRLSAQLTERNVVHPASFRSHDAVRDAIARKDARAARWAMQRIVCGMLSLIDSVTSEQRDSPGPREASTEREASLRSGGL